jgi:hypothetical protein
MGRAIKLFSDLSEKQIEADVAAYFGFHSSFFGEFRLLDVDEQLTGADKEFQWQGIAYLLQFKKPTGLRPLTKLGSRPSKQPLLRIQEFRLNSALEQTPYSVCFSLREPSQPKKPLQHNVLLAYEAPPYSRAFYVCPLALTQRDYVASLQEPRSEFGLPFRLHHPQWIMDGQFLARGAEICPFLRGHATVFPHKIVATAKHHYSFSASATDFAFHEPTLIEAGPSRLSDFVASELRLVKDKPDRLYPALKLAEQLYSSSARWDDGTFRAPNEENYWDWLRDHGRRLHREFGIRQMLVLRKQQR